jgi:hypothetical protein
MGETDSAVHPLDWIPNIRPANTLEPKEGLKRDLKSTTYHLSTNPKPFHGRYYPGETIDCGAQTCKGSSEHKHKSALNCGCVEVSFPLLNFMEKITLIQ